MKSRWLSEYERELKEQEKAQQVACEELNEQEGDKHASTLVDPPMKLEAARSSLQQPGQSALWQNVEVPEPAASPVADPAADAPQLDPAKAAEQELAMEAEAHALAELADSDSEGNRGIQETKGLVDMIVDSPPAHAAGAKPFPLHLLHQPSYCMWTFFWKVMF